MRNSSSKAHDRLIEDRHTRRVHILRRYALLLGLLMVPVLLALAGQVLLSRPGPPQLPEDAAAVTLNVQEADQQDAGLGDHQPAVAASDGQVGGVASAVGSNASRPAPEPAPAPAQRSGSDGSSSSSSRSRTVQRPVTSRRAPAPAPAPVSRDDDDYEPDDDDYEPDDDD